MHDASKVVLGGTKSSYRVVDNKPGTIAAGLIVRKKSGTTDEISVLKADGDAIGVSIGRDLSGVGRTHIVRAGLEVPIQLTAAFTPTVGTQVHISDTTGKAAASGAGATAINATYAKAGLMGIVEADGTEIDVALIDMPGGV